MAEACGALARVAGPEPAAASLGGTRRQPLGGLGMSYHEAGERHRIHVEQVWQSAEARVESIDKPVQPGVFVAQGRSEPGNTGGRAGSENRLLESTGLAPEDGRVEPASRERVFKRSEQWHRGEPAFGKLKHEPQKSAGRGAVKRQARRVIDLDPPPAQLDGNPAGEFAVAGDERRGRPRRLELAAQ